jgi:hypothetical protein
MHGLCECPTPNPLDPEKMWFGTKTSSRIGFRVRCRSCGKTICWVHKSFIKYLNDVSKKGYDKVRG